jgi:hypothetical protein
MWQNVKVLRKSANIHILADDQVSLTPVSDYYLIMGFSRASPNFPHTRCILHADLIQSGRYHVFPRMGVRIHTLG